MCVPRTKFMLNIGCTSKYYPLVELIPLSILINPCLATHIANVNIPS
jgi:hypothetical protein